MKSVMLSIILGILLNSERLGKPPHDTDRSSRRRPEPNDTPSDSGHRLWWGLVDPMCSVMDRSCSRAGQVSLGPVPTTVARQQPAGITPGGYMGGIVHDRDAHSQSRRRNDQYRPPEITTIKIVDATNPHVSFDPGYGTFMP